MKYKNLKTGFIFETPCEVKAEGWVKLDPQPKEEKPTKTKRKKNEELCNN